MTHRRLIVLLTLIASSVHGQWLNYRTPGTPRQADGAANLVAPAPRGLDGKPDLSGTWMHEISSVAEMKRIFGNRFEETVKVDVPGMELGTQHKYAFNILLDFKPGESPMRPAAAELMKKVSFARKPEELCTENPGIPLADLLSEPIKIVQSPRVSIILYEAGNAHRQIYTDGRELPKEFSLPAYYGYSVGPWRIQRCTRGRLRSRCRTSCWPMGMCSKASARTRKMALICGSNRAGTCAPDTNDCRLLPAAPAS
jgi:hypothetical protein